MPYLIRLDDDLAGEVRRVCRRQARHAIAALRSATEADPGTDPQADVEVDTSTEDSWDAGTHEARKACKRIRATIRLVRDALGDGYAPANATFRDAARLVSDARDAWTVIETVDGLSDDRSTQMGEDPDAVLTALQAVRADLVERYLRVRADTVARQVLPQAISALEDASAQIQGWPLPADLPAEDLAPSLARVYRRGRDGLTAAEETVGAHPHASTERWHDWRKRVKYLRDQMRLLELAWPSMTALYDEALDEIADAVGLDHDLAVLVDLVDTTWTGDPAVVGHLNRAVTHRRTQLRQAALEVGRLVYAEPPEAFAQRFTTYVALSRPASGGAPGH